MKYFDVGGRRKELPSVCLEDSFGVRISEQAGKLVNGTRRRPANFAGRREDLGRFQMDKVPNKAKLTPMEDLATSFTTSSQLDERTSHFNAVLSTISNNSNPIA